MNVRRGMFRLWVVLSVAWLLDRGFIGYQNVAAEQAQIAAIDECSKLYPPLPDGYVLNRDNCSAPPCTQQSGPWLNDPIVGGSSLLQQFDAAGAWDKWVDGEAKAHPQCAPNVGRTSLIDFMGMHASDRAAALQASANWIRTSNLDAIAYGFGVPAGLLAIGLILGWVARGFRKAA